jgi:hypothetical protein
MFLLQPESRRGDLGVLAPLREKVAGAVAERKKVEENLIV